MKAFVSLTFFFALVPFLVAALVGGSLFEDVELFPLLVLIVYSPSAAAFVLHWRAGSLRTFFGGFTRAPSSSLVWLAAFIPLVVSAAVGIAGDVGWPDGLTPGTLLVLVGFQLILGPLGEEAGWRGFLLPKMLRQFGTLGGPLLLGIIWGAWHLPLWTIDSPQAEIPVASFVATVICFSVLLAAIHSRSGGSLWPAIVFHLNANLGVALLAMGGMNAADAYDAALPLFVLCSVVAVLADRRSASACPLP